MTCVVGAGICEVSTGSTMHMESGCSSITWTFRL